MANTILTPTAVTREVARVLHQKLNFIGTIGDSLKIRLPNEYVVRTGATMSAQDTVETSETLQVSTQKGVDLSFTSVDLTLSLDDFSKRIIEPATSVLAAAIEADAMSMYLQRDFGRRCHRNHEPCPSGPEEADRQPGARFAALPQHAHAVQRGLA